MIRFDGIAGDEMDESKRESATFRKRDIDDIVSRHIEEWGHKLGLDPYYNRTEENRNE